MKTITYLLSGSIISLIRTELGTKDTPRLKYHFSISDEVLDIIVFEKNVVITV